MLTILVIALLLGAFAAKGKAAHSHRYQVARQLAAGLQGTPLAADAYAIEADGHRYNVNPYLLASIAGVESTFGEAACGGNAWGVGSCSMGFDTFADGAVYVARLIRTGYLNRGLADVWSIGRVYCPPCGSSWGDHVAYFMRSRFGVSASVTYP